MTFTAHPRWRSRSCTYKYFKHLAYHFIFIVTIRVNDQFSSINYCDDRWWSLVLFRNISWLIVRAFKPFYFASRVLNYWVDRMLLSVNTVWGGKKNTHHNHWTYLGTCVIISVSICMPLVHCTRAAEEDLVIPQIVSLLNCFFLDWTWIRWALISKCLFKMMLKVSFSHDLMNAALRSC